jgi:trans-2,3-dihydro-3-hydroxyanthranilate isomerase
MPSYRYLHLDVFTDRPFEGNQLAVFPEPQGLTPHQMQRIAQEMAFSETTFIFPREGAGDVRMRIFTPEEELPMAGHPTIGSTFALAHEGIIAAGRTDFVFELGVGPTPVGCEWKDGRLAFAWMTQKRPEWGPTMARGEATAAALGLQPSDLAEPRLPHQQISCGLPFLFVPLATRRAVDAIAVDRAALARACAASGLPELPVFVFTMEPGTDEATVYSRMFAPGFGIAEDPATGGASGPLGCYLVRYGLVAAGKADAIVSLQGVRMGRPSRIHIAIAAGAGGEIERVQVGGRAVLVGQGSLEAP